MLLKACSFGALLKFFGSKVQHFKSRIILIYFSFFFGSMRGKCYFNNEIRSKLIFGMFHELNCFENSYTVHKMVHG